MDPSKLLILASGIPFLNRKTDRVRKKTSKIDKGELP
jgi:hypothetical protein